MIVGQIGKLLSFVRSIKNNGAKVSDVTCNLGGTNNNILAENFPPAGDDSFPLTNDYVLLVPIKGEGRYQVCGYLDIKNEPKAAAGDKRIYARNANGDSVVELWLKNDESGTLSNSNGSVTLEANGDVKVVTQDATFDVLSNGIIEGKNQNGFFRLESSGDFNVNGLVINAAGSGTSPGSLNAQTITGSSSVQAAGKELAGHTHPSADPPANTGPNN